jgi:hypothetical protein
MAGGDYVALVLVSHQDIGWVENGLRRLHRADGDGKARIVRAVPSYPSGESHLAGSGGPLI